jgi:hypothetical protein
LDQGYQVRTEADLYNCWHRSYEVFFYTVGWKCQVRDQAVGAMLRYRERDWGLGGMRRWTVSPPQCMPLLRLGRAVRSFARNSKMISQDTYLRQERGKLHLRSPSEPMLEFSLGVLTQNASFGIVAHFNLDTFRSNQTRNKDIYFLLWDCANTRYINEISPIVRL